MGEVSSAARVERIPVMDVTPVVENGRFPAKAAVGESFEVTAVVFREGHDQLGCDVLLTDPGGTTRAPVRMEPVEGTVNRYAAEVSVDAPGAWSFQISSWSDPLATWLHDAGLKIRAGVDVELMFTEGVLLLERMKQTDVVAGAVKALRDTKRPVEARLAVAEDPALAAEMHANPLRDLESRTAPYPLQVDRERALFSSWYEFFPRSEGATRNDDGTITSGTFRTAMKRIPAVAAMGFDVLYLPPIHPIGEVNRKGPNNTLTPGPTDVGSPWAIGSEHGGHDAIHPDLGTLEDFDAFVAEASRHGLEVALDFALQAAPDHPWVASNPQWFTTRADGTIAYAENPPKKYQDIYPINFDNDPEGIYAECLRVLRHWMSHGVRIFRVDNPHTKPLAFWDWLLGQVRATDPDVLFLSEAFTRPPMMHALAKVGFHQSYTYFTWRNTREEIESYLQEVSHESSHFLRPNFFVNTPDILHAFLQHGGPAAFRIRAILAATSSPSWGVYAGFELFEGVAVRPGSEEYLDSEKYQVRIRDWAAAEAEGRTLAPLLTQLNALRRAHPALQQLRNLAVHPTEDPHVVCFSKTARWSSSERSEQSVARWSSSERSAARWSSSERSEQSVARWSSSERSERSVETTDTVIVVLNVDPHGAHETMVHLDLSALGLPPGASLDVHDELSDQTWLWGADNYVRLDPRTEVAHVLTVRSRA